MAAESSRAETASGPEAAGAAWLGLELDRSAGGGRYPLSAWAEGEAGAQAAKPATSGQSPPCPAGAPIVARATWGQSPPCPAGAPIVAPRAAGQDPPCPDAAPMVDRKAKPGAQTHASAPSEVSACSRTRVRPPVRAGPTGGARRP